MDKDIETCNEKVIYVNKDKLPKKKMHRIMKVSFIERPVSKPKETKMIKAFTTIISDDDNN